MLVFALPLSRYYMKNIYRDVQKNHPKRVWALKPLWGLIQKTKGSSIRFLIPLIILLYFADFKTLCGFFLFLQNPGSSVNQLFSPVGIKTDCVVNGLQLC